MREVRIWSTFRNKLEILKNAHNKLLGSIYGHLVGYYPLNDNTDV